MANEEYLYHYTNVSSLAMILKNKSIRFSPLSVLDDKEERMHNDSKNYSKYVFVSSWTDDEVESIPMWKMYTSSIEGVRIRLPKYPFCTYTMTVDDLRNEGFTGVEGSKLDIVIPFKEYVCSSYLLSNYVQEKTLIKVLYTDDLNKLNPKIVHNEQGINIELGKLGVYKNTYWEFQHEWRYILRFLPISLKHMMEEPNDENEMIKVIECSNLPFDLYYLNINDEIFNKMEIMLSPQINEGNREIVRALVDKYNPSAKILESKLIGRI